jgi:thiol-disulfide isomerase/thioredoxin
VKVVSQPSALSTIKTSPSMVYYTADWCGPCKRISPSIDKLSDEFPAIDFFKVDIDLEDMRDHVMDAQIRAVPSFHAYKVRLLKLYVLLTLTLCCI